MVCVFMAQTLTAVNLRGTTSTYINRQFVTYDSINDVIVAFWPDVGPASIIAFDTYVV